MRTLLALFVATTLLLSCKEKGSAVSDELSVEQAEALIQAEPNLQIIDVRSPGETKAGMIQGAKLIPSYEFEKRFTEIKKDAPVLLYCAGGGRSEIALDFLKKQGYGRAVHLGQGFDGWKHAGKSVQK